MQERTPGKVLKICSRCAHLTLYAAVLLFIAGTLAGGWLFWKLRSGPLDVGFAKPYVEKALNGGEHGYAVTIGQIRLDWTDLTSRPALDLEDVRVMRGEERASLSIARMELLLSRRHLLIGLVRPAALVLDAPALELVRRNGQIGLFLQDQEIMRGAEEENNSDKGDIRTQIAEFFAEIGAGGYGRGPLSELGLFKIQNAQVVVRDYEAGVSWYLTDMDFSLLDHPQGVSASIALALPGGRKGATDIGMDLVYRRRNGDFSLTAVAQNMDPSILSMLFPDTSLLGEQDLQINGQAKAVFAPDLSLQNASATFSIPEGTLSIPQEYDAPLSLKDIILEASYTAGDNLTELDMSGTVSEVPLTAHAQANINPDIIEIPISVSIAELPLKAIQPLFPKSEQDGEAALWLIHKMSGGRFYDSTIELPVTLRAVRETPDAKKQWSVHAPLPQIEFAFEGVTVRYSDTLMPAENAKGTGVLADDSLIVKGESAQIGDIKGRNMEIKITDLTVTGGGLADIKLEAAGPLATALKYASDEPIAVGDTLGFNPKDAGGEIDMRVHLNFPTLKDLPKEAVKVKIDATLSDLKIPGVVKGLDLTGGPLKLKSEDGAFYVTGKAFLAGRDIALDWTQYFESEGNPFSAQVKAQIGADQELRKHFGVNLDEWISGTIPIDVVYTDKGNSSATIDVRGNLNPVRIEIEPFRYVKPSGIEGEVSLKAFLENDVLQEIDTLALKTQDFSLDGGRLIFDPVPGGARDEVDLSRGTIASAMIGRTVMAVDFGISPQQVLKISAKGPVFDAQPFLSGDANAEPVSAGAVEEEESPPMMLSVSADRMYTRDQRFIDQTKLYLETNQAGEPTRLEMDAKAGAGNIYVRFKPEEETGRRTFRLEAVDGGAVLRAFDLYDNVLGGRLLIYGEPQGRDMDGDLFGTARLEDFRVVRAPALARVLGAMSVEGVEKLLGNESQGMTFSKLESKFEWRFRPEGNLLVLKDGRTSGSSLGLTFGGTIDRTTNTIDVTGTIIPVSGLNTMLSAIPLVGDILTGGKDGGLIAATYTIKGPAQDPKVSVNPLSVLAPGILRKILFEGGYETEVPEKK